jgi:hypothetical protein
MRLRLLPVVVLVLAAGCGGDGKPAAVPAGGTVMYQNKPAVGALVVYSPVDVAVEQAIGGKAQGRVKEDGTFTLTMYADGDGAPPGEYNVLVQWPGKLSLSGEGGGGGDRFNGKYSNQQSPKFKFTVKKGDPNKFDIKLD